MLKVLQVAGFALFFQMAKSSQVGCIDDVYTHLAGDGEVSFPKTNFIPLNISFPAFPMVIDSGSVLIAAARRDCGKVVVIGKTTPLYRKGFAKLITNCINSLVPANNTRNICILPGIKPRVRPHITKVYKNTLGGCIKVVSVNDILGEVKQCAVILASAARDYTDEEDAAILKAVSDGAGLLVAGKAGVNNDLTEPVGIKFIKENLKAAKVTSRGVDMDLLPVDPGQCIFTQPDFGDEAPCNITSIANQTFVPVEGIGAGYYGAGRVAIIGSQPILTSLFKTSNNRFLLRDVITFVSQSRETCNCTMGCFTRCGAFETFSENYANAFGVTIPVKGITEACGSCCVALNLRDVNSIDTNMLYAYVREGGCLILTCRDKSDQYDANAINAFLLPFGFKIGFTDRE